MTLIHTRAPSTPAIIQPSCPRSDAWSLSPTSTLTFATRSRRTMSKDVIEKIARGQRINFDHCDRRKSRDLQLDSRHSCRVVSSWSLQNIQMLRRFVTKRLCSLKKDWTTTETCIDLERILVTNSFFLVSMNSRERNLKERFVKILENIPLLLQVLAFCYKTRNTTDTWEGIFS